MGLHIFSGCRATDADKTIRGNMGLDITMASDGSIGYSCQYVPHSLAVAWPSGINMASGGRQPR